MPIVLQLPRVKSIKVERPAKCKYCDGEIFQRWGKVKKKLKDTKIRKAQIYRYLCTSCQRTFRHYPEGISHAQQSERLKKLAVICWSLGLSYRGLELILSAFGISLSRMSGWRNVQLEGEMIRKSMKWKQVRVVGVDGAWLNGTGVMVAVDMGEGEVLSIAQIDEKDMSAVLNWLRALKHQHGIGAIVTDDLKMYRGITQQLELGHQVCQFHVRRWVGRTCWELKEKLSEEWLWMLEEVKIILAELPPDGSKRLYEMWKLLPGNRRRAGPRSAVQRLRRMLIHLHTSWERYTAFFHDPVLPWTNNWTEQAIGKFKVRAKSTRGYKSEPGRLNALLVSCTKLH